jgi:hypothetical protein
LPAEAAITPVTGWLAVRHQAQASLLQRAALLEGGGELQVLELQEDARAEDLARGCGFPGRAWPHT